LNRTADNLTEHRKGKLERTAEFEKNSGELERKEET
jgi:hypothetical protein